MNMLFSDITPVWLLVKIGALIFMGVYMVFAFIVVRQVSLMTKTLELGLEGTMKFVAYLHFLFAIATFIISLLYL